MDSLCNAEPEGAPDDPGAPAPRRSNRLALSGLMRLATQLSRLIGSSNGDATTSDVHPAVVPSCTNRSNSCTVGLTTSGTVADSCAGRDGSTTSFPAAMSARWLSESFSVSRPTALAGGAAVKLSL